MFSLDIRLSVFFSILVEFQWILEKYAVATKTAFDKYVNLFECCIDRESSC